MTFSTRLEAEQYARECLHISYVNFGKLSPDECSVLISRLDSMFASHPATQGTISFCGSMRGHIAALVDIYLRQQSELNPEADARTRRRWKQQAVCFLNEHPYRRDLLAARRFDDGRFDDTPFECMKATFPAVVVNDSVCHRRISRFVSRVVDYYRRERYVLSRI